MHVGVEDYRFSGGGVRGANVRFRIAALLGGGQVLLCAGTKYARAARITASTAIVNAAYVIHCNAFGCPLGKTLCGFPRRQT